MNRNRMGTAAVSLLLTACYPLEQAPLVYTSKVQFGIQVNAGVPESPGLEVNIGLKALDAALVPVAVAKHCGESHRSQCENSIYDVKPLSGMNSAGGSVNIDRDALTNTETRLEQNSRDLAKAQAAISADEALKVANAAQRNRVASLQSELAGIGAVTPSAADVDGAAQRTSRALAIQTELDKIGALENDATIDLRIQNNKNGATALAVSVEQDKQVVLRMRAVRNARRDDDKADAFSVYGTFGGSADGSTKGANLTFGKVFSTGIASQNLTQGVGQAALLKGQTDCIAQMIMLLDHAKSALGDEKSKAFIADAAGLCSSPNALPSGVVPE